MNEYMLDCILLIAVYLILRIMNRKKLKKEFIIVCFCILAFRMAFRDITVGSDIIRYQNRYIQYQRSMELNLLSEPLFKLLNLICAFLSKNYGFRLLLIISSVFIVGVFSYITYKYSENVLISYLTYLAFEFYLFEFSGIRQAIAMSFLLLAFDFCVKQKLMSFIVMVAAAYGFHRTAVVFLICYFVRYFKWNKKRLFIMLLLFIVIITNLSQLGNYILTYVGENFEYFSSGGKYGTVSFIIMLLIIAEYLFNSPIKNKTSENIILNNIMIVSLIVQMLSSVSYNFTRLNLYFFQFSTIYFANIISRLDSNSNTVSFSKRTKKMIICAITVALLLLYYIRISKNPYDVLPYKFMGGGL